MYNKQPISTFLGIAAAVVLVSSSSGFSASPCPEDINGDGAVNVLDLVALLGCFGQPAVPDCESEDFNGDGAVNALDLVALVLNFGPCPTSSCPWDVNEDGTVGSDDRAEVLANMGPCADPSNCPWDVNGDGVVNGLDLIAVDAHFGPCPTPTCLNEDNSNAYNMNPVAFETAEDFTPIADGTVASGRVWLVTLDGGTTHDLRVKYYLNDPVDDIPDDDPDTPLGTFSLGDGTLTQTGPSFTGTNVVGFLVQELSWRHAGVPVDGGQCYWVEVTDTTPTSIAFWERGTGGNARAVQDGVPLNGYDPTDVVPTDLRFCLDILWDVSDCHPLVP